ncbi:hypothetical protein C8R45DRAFT_1101989 [Mycena sanguinolenta]|nr:hypothetical protein C8R45DRAFT_1101989 [Mycena sanguinolenta]
MAIVRLCHAQSNMTTNTTTVTSVKEWTPPDFDWVSLRALAPPKAEWKGLYINKTKGFNSTAVDLIDSEFMRLDVDGPHELIFLAWLAVLSWGAIANIALGVAGTVSAVQGCVTDDGSAWGNYNCIVGLAGTVWGVGTAYGAAKSAAAGWMGSPRSQDTYQELHERLLHSILQRSFGGAEHIGYVSDAHRLSRRNDEHLHPRAPIFRVKHPRHGAMDIAAREHLSGTRFTITFANGVGKLGKRAFRCGFDQLESSIKCYTSEWQAGSALNAQLYDASSRATLGYASMGLFENSDEAAQLEAYAPITPQPITGCAGQSPPPSTS